MIKIETPRGTVVQTKNGKATLKWNSDFAAVRSENFNRAQKFLDSEVLRGCAKFVPLRTGMLVKSGILGTVIGSGTVKYIAPYAKQQYYHNGGHGQDHNRGRLWFEHWKAERGAETIAKTKALAGGKNE